MSTTRHLINRHRRLAAVTVPAAAAPARTALVTAVPAVPAGAAPPEGARARLRPWTALLLLAVLLGVLAAAGAVRTAGLHAGSAAGNTALTDPVRTGEVRGAVAQAVGSLFSYNYAEPARTEEAAAKLLTGKAVQQHAALLAEVRAQAAERKLVLTTTVTDSGVELLDGDRARVLVFADQRNTGIAQGASADATYAAAMFAVDVVHRDGRWLVENIDTFGR